MFLDAIYIPSYIQTQLLLVLASNFKIAKKRISRQTVILELSSSALDIIRNSFFAISSMPFLLNISTTTTGRTTDRQTNGRTEDDDGRTDGRTDGRNEDDDGTDVGWTDGRTDVDYDGTDGRTEDVDDHGTENGRTKYD